MLAAPRAFVLTELSISTSAPGKLFLLGEYAVLDGAPAVLVPVRQRAQVQIDAGSTTTVLAETTQKSQTLDALASLPLVRHVTETLKADGLIAAPVEALLRQGKLSIILDTSAFYLDNQKLGLGSSAALTAALCRALATPDTPVIDAAMRAHRAFQGGRGSGADVALSALDSPIVFRRDEPPVTVEIPDHVHMLFIWSGFAAKTTDYLEKVQYFQNANPDAYEAHLAGLSAIAVAGADAIECRQADRFVDSVADYNKQLSAFSQASGANFYTEAHVELRKRVELAECIYKPSGAGGGDFGIAFSTSGENIRKLRDALVHEGRFCFLHADFA